MFCRFRVCLNCGSISRLHIGFCSTCFAELEKLSGNLKQLHIEHRVLETSSYRLRYMYRWIPNKNRPLSNLVESLKGNSRRKEWQEIAHHYCKKYLSTCKPINPIFLPIGNAYKQKDHAYFFAEALAAELGTQCISTLFKTDSKQQKRGKAFERSRIHFENSENFTDLYYPNKQLVIVDDVVTTGYTALAAIKSLSCPKNVEVWSFAFRGLADL